MPKHDDVHFDEYTDQNQAKHAILSGYLPAYLTALNGFVSQFHYIDGFAGKGSYGDGFPGSPLIAMDIIDSKDVASKSLVSLIEKIPDFHKNLNALLQSHPSAASLSEPPLLRKGEFHQHVDEILSRPKSSKVGTFAFIDPCGVDGVRIKDLARILKLKYGEILLFFNYDGINRLVGLAQSDPSKTRILSELYGSNDRVQELLKSLSGVTEPDERKIIIRDHFFAALRKDSGANYFIPFMFESKDKQKTSHYIVYCCSNSLGFKIMKGVMHGVGDDGTDDFGKLSFVNDKDRGSQFALFRTDIEQQKKKILDHLSNGPCQAKVFKVNWVLDPNDAFSEKAYTRILLQLEESGTIVVYDKLNSTEKPVSKRRKHQGMPTLGPDNWIRLAAE